MSVTHPAGIRNDIADFVVDKLDSGTATNPSGRLIFDTSGDVEVATLPLSVTAFGAAAAGIATAAAITSDANATGGTVAKCKLVDRSGSNVIIKGSVTLVAGGGDIELSSVLIGAGDTVAMTSLTYTAPA